MVNLTVLATKSCVKIETRTDNRSEVYFAKKYVKIYYSTMLNKNRIVFLLFLGIRLQ